MKKDKPDKIKLPKPGKPGDVTTQSGGASPPPPKPKDPENP
jgi:hypothetical protein